MAEAARGMQGLFKVVLDLAKTLDETQTRLAALESDLLELKKGRPDDQPDDSIDFFALAGSLTEDDFDPE